MLCAGVLKATPPDEPRLSQHQQASLRLCPALLDHSFKTLTLRKTPRGVPASDGHSSSLCSRALSSSQRDWGSEFSRAHVYRLALRLRPPARSRRLRSVRSSTQHRARRASISRMEETKAAAACGGRALFNVVAEVCGMPSRRCAARSERLRFRKPRALSRPSDLRARHLSPTNTPRAARSRKPTTSAG